jgi:beta-glucosidase
MLKKKSILRRYLVIVLSIMIVTSTLIPMPAAASSDSESPAAAAVLASPEAPESSPGSSEPEVYKYPFQDPKLTANARVDDLISRMTLDEKIALLHQFSGAIIRLGVPQFRTGTEGLHGLSWLGYATVFPQNTGLSMSWDKELIKKVGGVVGKEARAYNSVDARFNGIDIWAPVIDLARDPRSGRASESMGEDAYLSGMMSTNYAYGLRGSDPFYYETIPTLKHFAAYGQEASRDSYSANASPRNLYEYYLKAFSYGISSGAVNSTMTSYNLVNGKPTMTMPQMMTDLFGKWVDGGLENGSFFTVTDASSPTNLTGNNSYYPNSDLGKAKSMADSIKNGVSALTPSDTDTPTTRRMIYEAIARGMLTEQDINKTIHGVLVVRCHAGDLDVDPDNNPYKQLNKQNALTTSENSEVALEAAHEQVVLLKNEGNILPLSKSSKVALSGPLTDENSTDFYAGTFPYVTYIKNKVQDKLAGGLFSFTRGLDVLAFQVTAGTGTPNGKYISAGATDSASLTGTGTSPDDPKNQFYLYDYGYNNVLLRSVAFDKYLTATGASNSVAANGRAPGFETANRASQEWSTNTNLGFVGVSGNTVSMKFVKGTGYTSPTATPGVYVNTSAPYNLQHNGSGTSSNRQFSVVTVLDGKAEAAAKAAGADVAVVCVGDQPSLTSRETQDRNDGTDNIKLPQQQQNLIDAVSAVNPNTVVVIVGSYPFDITAIKNNPNVKGIVYTTHAGQELGTAVADVLFGDYAPAGRLNQTWYAGLDQIPKITDYDIIKGERTYQYFKGNVLYPFGYGLSYSTFTYSITDVSPSTFSNNGNGDITVSVKVKNTGTVNSDEVVQLYSKYKDAASSQVKHPVKTLNGFERIHLNAGEAKDVTFNIKKSELAIWDVSNSKFFVEPGDYTFMVGHSSADKDLRSSADITVTGASIPARSLSDITPAYNFDDYSFTESVTTGTSLRDADVIQASAMEDDTYYIQARKANSWVEYKNVDISAAPQGISMRVSNSNSTTAAAEVWVKAPSTTDGGILLGIVTVPKTGNIQTFVNTGATFTGLAGSKANIYLVFKSNNIGVKWLKLGTPSPAANADIVITSNYYNSSASTSLSRLHVRLDPIIYQKSGKLLMEAMINGSGIVNDTVVWSVTNEDGSPTANATIDTSGVLTAAASAVDGKIKVVATYPTDGGPVSASKLVELKNQTVTANTNAEAIVIRSGYDSRPADISWGPNQFTNFGSIYKKGGTLLLSAVTYPARNPARPVTFTLADKDGKPTDLAVITGTPAAGFVEGQTSGDNNRAINCTIQATGKGDGEVYLTATTTTGDAISYTSRIIIQGQGTRNPYNGRIEAELFDDSGNTSTPGAVNLRADNVTGDDVGLQLNRIRDYDYAVYKDYDFGTDKYLKMDFRYVKVSSEPATITVMLDSPVTGTAIGVLNLAGDKSISGDYSNVVYNWKNASINLNSSISGVHNIYLKFAASSNIPNTDISSTYNTVAGWLDLGINWFTFEETMSPVTGAAITVGEKDLTLIWTDPADKVNFKFDHIKITGDDVNTTVAKGVQKFNFAKVVRKNYAYTITAVDTKGNESTGITVAGTDPDTTAAADVSGVTVIAGNGKIVLAWADPADVDFNHVAVTGASLVYTTQPGMIYTVNKGIRHKVIDNLTNDTQYSFTIKTVDNAENLSAGIPVTGTPSALAVPDTQAPAEVTGTSVATGNGKLTLKWIDPSDTDFINIKVTGEGINPIFVAKGVQGLSIDNLQNDTQYTFTIKTVDYWDNESTGSTVTGTPDGTAPANVTSASAIAGNGKLDITWTDPSDADFTNAIISGTGFDSVTVGKGTQNATIGNLDNGTEYTVTIKTVDSTGNVSDGIIVKGTPADTTAPAEVADATAVSGNGKLDITWTDPSDTDFTNAIISGTGFNPVTVGKGTQKATISNLNNGSEYTIIIKTVDNAGNVSDGITVKGTPRASVTPTDPGSGDSAAPPVSNPGIVSKPAETKEDGTVNIPTDTLIKTNGTTAIATVPQETFNKALDQAKADVNGIKRIELVMPLANGVNEYSMDLPSDVLSSKTKDKVVEINTPAGSILVPGNMLSASDVGNAQNVVLSIASADKSKLESSLKEKIGDRPVIDLSLNVNGKSIAWNNPDAPVSVSISYKPTATELADPEHIVIWYIDGQGSIVSVPDGKYDVATGKVTFKTTHFSRYAIAFVKKTFSDIGNVAWAKKEIEVLASKGVISGTSTDTYTPAAKITRADFMSLLVKGLGLTTKVDSNFADVKTTDNYYNALGIAKKLGITNGVGENKFDPKGYISRQDMMVLTARALKISGKITAYAGSDILLKYKDASSFSSYSLDGAATLVSKGIITGSENKLNPKGNATRAETAVIIYRVFNLK